MLWGWSLGGGGEKRVDSPILPEERGASNTFFSHHNLYIETINLEYHHAGQD